VDSLKGRLAWVSDMIRLENWGIRQCECVTPIALEDKKYILYGEVYNHPRFNNGEFVVTTKIKSFKHIKMIAKTMNNTYEMGIMNKEFGKYLIDNGKEIGDYEK